MVRGSMRGSGRSRQRQKTGAVGQVTRAMVVARPSVRMVIDWRSSSESGWRQVAHSSLPASRLQWLSHGRIAPPPVCAKAVRKLVHVGAPQRGHGNLLAGPVNGHRLQGRLLRQSIRQRPRQAVLGAGPVFAGSGRGCSHIASVTSSTLPQLRRWKTRG